MEAFGQHVLRGLSPCRPVLVPPTHRPRLAMARGRRQLRRRPAGARPLDSSDRNLRRGDSPALPGRSVSCGAGLRPHSHALARPIPRWPVQRRPLLSLPGHRVDLRREGLQSRPLSEGCFGGVRRQPRRSGTLSPRGRCLSRGRGVGRAHVSAHLTQSIVVRYALTCVLQAHGVLALHHLRVRSEPHARLSRGREAGDCPSWTVPLPARYVAMLTSVRNC